jgi:hypothetical protein
VFQVCQTCIALSGRLVEVTKRVTDALTRMADPAGAAQHAEFETAKRDVQSLRNECRVIRLEIERHRAEHESSHRLLHNRAAESGSSRVQD